MDAYEPSSPINIRNHYTIVNKRRGRVKCKHCGKELSSASRLKYHLGGVRGNVLPCPNVPTNIRHVFNREVLIKKKDCADLPSKRNLSSSSNCFKQSKPKKSTPISAFADVKKDLPSDHTKSISSFLRQDCLDYPCRQDIRLGTIGKGNSEFSNMPIYSYLHSEILKIKMKEVQGYIEDIKQSWSSSGCSILMDGWINEEGRELVTFLMKCPRGSVYLDSYDVSSLNGSVDALYGMVNAVVEEIGEHNVVQVIASSITGWMGILGKQFIKKCKTVFWSTSASHCISLMLEKISRLEHIKVILEKANEVLELIENSGGLNLNLVKPSKMGLTAVSFETLENIVLAKNKLDAMVNDPCFWNGATMVVKATKPLVHVLDLIHGDDNLLSGYIYEAIDQAKETIRDDLKIEDGSNYMLFWNIIDEIWDNHLHSPLHAAGYYLNPSLFYSSDFHIDGEVSFGLLCCVVRMFLDHRTQDLISLQLDDYRLRRGAFKEACTPHNRSIPPCIYIY